MKIFKENFWEQVFINVTSSIIVSAIISLISIAVVIFISIYDPFKKIVEETIPASTLIILILILFVSLIVSILYTVSLKKKAKLNLKKALGIYWDKELNAYCPSCQTLLSNYAFYQTVKNYEPGFKCISCDKIIHFGDEVEPFYRLEDAKKLVREMFEKPR